MIDPEEPFFLWEMPEWMCPTCNKGLLHLNKPEHHISQWTAYRHKIQSSFDFNPEHVEERGVFSLQCQNARCKETVCVTASGKMKRYLDERQQEPDSDIRFVPSYFDPPLHFFQISENVPEDVRAAILEAFALVWAHPDSAGNAIRRSVENLLSHLESTMQGGLSKGETTLSLAKRIKKFGKRDGCQESSDRLSALKWLGNAGSHSGEELSKQDVLDCFEILDSTLELLFCEDEQNVKKKVSQIIERKGPRK